MTLISLLISVVSLFLYGYFFNRPVINYYSGPGARQVVEKFLIEDHGFQSIVKNVNPTIVFIQTIKENENKIRSIESGSGVIITSDGYIVTNEHVIREHDNIIITTFNNKQYNAELIGSDELTDIAVLKIKNENLPFLFIADSHALNEGDIVLAFGNPFRLKNSVSMGIVSARNRNLNILGAQGIESYIQTDAIANSGNSGGALVNTSGKMVGLIAAVNLEKEIESGFSFAIPSNIVKKAVFDIINYRAVQRARTGMSLVDIQPGNNVWNTHGAEILRIEKDGPAFKSGLKAGDLILKLDSINVIDASYFQALIYEKKPGDVVTLSFLRNGKENTAKISLKNAFNTDELISSRKDKILSDFGLIVRDLTSSEITSLKTKGVIVISIMKNSKAGLSNMEPDYIITEINSEPVKTVDEMIEKIKKSSGRISFNGFYKSYPGNFPYFIEK
ncbi:MAG: trypsin-like peptidase domain-containing protein [Deltaproteobacteria bacterium]